MTCKFDINLQKYFKLYRDNVMKIKETNQIQTVGRSFDSIFNVTKGNFNIIMTAPS